MTRLLIDASVWLAARGANEPHHADVAALISHGGADAAALDLTLCEVANVAIVRKKSVAEAAAMLDMVDKGCDGVIARVDAELVAFAAAIAAEHGISVYDAAYVAAARRNDWTLVSLDERDLVGPGLAIAPGDVSLAG